MFYRVWIEVDHSIRSRVRRIISFGEAFRLPVTKPGLQLLETRILLGRVYISINFHQPQPFERCIDGLTLWLFKASFQVF